MGTWAPTQEIRRSATGKSCTLTTNNVTNPAISHLTHPIELPIERLRQQKDHQTHWLGSAFLRECKVIRFQAIRRPPHVAFVRLLEFIGVLLVA
jgi:hypothetical protein